MKIIQPKPFTFKTEGTRAILLLHGFTGNSADVRMLGRFLEKKGYTSHAPIYRGHGKAPEELLKWTPEDWWDDVLEAYNHLVDLGYNEIAVAGLSLGGILGLKLATMDKVKAVIPMCSPMFSDNKSNLTAGFKLFSKEYKELEQKDSATIEEEIKEIFKHAPNTFEQVGQFNDKVRDDLHLITVPTMVVQARKDEMINIDSAPYIYNHVSSETKELKWYEKSGHVITFGPERDKLHKDIYVFLESLKWED